MAQTSQSNWIGSCLGCFRNCFGFYKSAYAPIIGDDSSKIEDRGSQKPLLYDSFLSSRTYDLEHSYFHLMNNSSVSVQSLEKCNFSFNQQAAGSSVDSQGQGFRNQGLLLWNETRQQWLSHKRQRRKSQEIGNPRISWNATYENLLGANRRFSQPIPLSEMVDFLVDVWEQEGLYENTTFGII